MVDYPAGGVSGGSGGSVGTGEFYTTQRYMGSQLTEVVDPKFVSIESLAQLPNQLYAEGDLQSWQTLTDLVKNAGFSSFDEALAAAAMDPEKANRSWRDYLESRAQDPELQAWLKTNNPDPEEQGGPYSYSTTTTTISPESSAASLLDQTFEAELGRRATDDEIALFLKAYNEMQRQNPTVSLQAGVDDGNGGRTGTATTTGGFDPTRFATEWAQEQPEYEGNFAATTFMGLLDKMISKPDALDSIASGG